MKRVVRALGIVALATVVFVVAAAVSVLVHVRLPIARRVIAARIDRALETSFAGNVRVEGLESVGLHGAHARRVVADDPDGVRVLRASEVDLDVGAIDAVRAALTGDEIEIQRVHVHDGDVSLDETPQGLRLARAFAPKHPSPSKEPSKLKLAIDDAVIDHAWVHGRVSNQSLDFDVDRARGVILERDGQLGIRVDGAEVTARDLPQHADLRGHVAGGLEDREELHLVAAFSGEGAEIPLVAVGRLDGQRFSARARTARAPAERIRSLVPGAPIHEDVSADAFVEGTSRAFGFELTGGIGPALVDGGGVYDDGAVHAAARASHLDLRAFEPSIGRTDARADAVLDYRRGAASLRGHFDPRGGHATIVAALDEHTIDADVTATISDARAVLAPFVGRTKLGGHGALHARVRYARDAEMIGTDASAELEDVSAGPVSAGLLRVRGSADGPVADPSLDVDVYAERTVVPKVHVQSARFGARGRLHDAHVTARVAADGPFDLAARVAVDPRGAVAVDDLTVAADRKLVLRGSLGFGRGRAEARLTGRNIDLARIQKTLGLEIPLSGTLGLDVDARLAGKSLEGRVAIDARKLDVADKVKQLDALVDVSDLGGACSVQARASMPKLGWVSLESGDLRIDGPSLEPASWARATGSLHGGATINLESLGALRHDEKSVRGWGNFTLLAERRTRRGAPDVSVTLTTKDFELTKQKYKLAVDARARMDPAGSVSAHVAVAHERERATLDATSKLDWDDLREGRRPNVETLPFTADLSVPAVDLRPICRDLGSLCEGGAAVSAHAEGPLARTRGNVAVRLSSFRALVSPLGEPSDASLVGSFDRDGASADVTVSRAGSTARELDAHVAVTIPRDPSEWSASVDGKLWDLPLRTPPVYLDEPITARVSGTASVHDLHRDARARVDLRAADLDVGGVRTESATVAGGFDGRTLALVTHLRADGATLDAHGEADATWGAALAPKLAANAPLRFGLRAGKFRLRTLTPLLPTSVGAVDGRLDADATGTLLPKPTRLSLLGWAKLSNGTIESSSLGQIHDLEGRLDAHQGGTIDLTAAQFRGTRGLVKLHGRALMPGGTLRQVEVGAVVDRSAPFALVIGGERIGDVWGKIDATARAEGKGFAGRVDIPSLHVVMPEEAHRSLQDLAPTKDISIGVRDRRGELVPVALAPPAPVSGPSTPITLDVVLGNDVRVQRGTTLDVTVTGRPSVKIAEKTSAYGTIRLVRGTLDVEGKRFRIRHGIVTFDGDPTNPTLDVAAEWDAPDRTHVTAQYLGRAENGQLKLSSDPPHTQDEIVALLVFGSATGPTPSTGGTTGALAAATAVGGVDFATQPLNKALEQLTHVDVRTRIDTTGATAKSAVEVQISKRIWAQIAYVLGLPPPGTEPDRTWLTLAWHATAHLSFDFTIGDHGSTIVDALWEKRY